jgi:ABC-type antimicrobial peptide transport system permease subunit
MLRTIGFPRRTILFSFTFESVLLCIPACLAGLGAARVLSGSRRDYLSDATWTVLAFELIIDFTIVAASLGLATLVGVVGAMAPALKAVRTPVIEALRKA